MLRADYALQLLLQKMPIQDAQDPVYNALVCGVDELKRLYMLEFWVKELLGEYKLTDNMADILANLVREMDNVDMGS